MTANEALANYLESLPPRERAIKKRDYYNTTTGGLRIFPKTDGELKRSKRIRGFHEIISAIAPLPDGRVLIGMNSYRHSVGELGVLSGAPPTLQNLKQAILDGKITAH